MTEQERFARSLSVILHHEGGYVDHKDDPGGATNRGVTLATARAYDLDKDGDGDVDKADVRLLTKDDAACVYRDGYWKAASCDKLPAGVDLVVFDCAVNQGVARAKAFLQEALGVKADGQIGPKTLAALKAANKADLVQRVCDLRRAHYQSLKTFPTFGKGWMRRLNQVTACAHMWAKLAEMRG
jgi:lysozyme family protein